MTVSSVETVRGSLPVDRLGATLMHEHLVVCNVEMEQTYPTFSEDDIVDKAAGRLNAMRQNGIETIVDLTVLGTGRNIARAQRIAALTPANIVVATGIYFFDALPEYWYFREPEGDARDALTTLFVRDVCEGIGDSGVKAAVLKCTTGPRGLTPDIRRALRATAVAQRETGAPIWTHTPRGKFADDQQRILAEHGVPLERVVISHATAHPDRDYLKAIMDRGSFLCMDGFGVDDLDPARVDNVVALCSLGYASRMVLAHDSCCHEGQGPPTERPNWHFSYLPQQIIPRLLKRGVTPAQLDQMLKINPVEILPRR